MPQTEVRKRSAATPDPDAGESRRTQAERSAIAESRMVRAAIDLINSVGVAGATLKAIGEQAGYSRGLAALDAANEVHLNYVMRHRDRLRAMYALWFGALDPGSDFKPNVARFMKRQRETMAQWIRDGQAAGEISTATDPDRAAQQIYASLVGINLQWLIDANLDLTRAYEDLRRDTRCLLQPA